MFLWWVGFTSARSKAVVLVLFAFVALWCFFGVLSCSLSYDVFSGSPLALWSPYSDSRSWLLCFALVCCLCTVCLGLFAHCLGVIRRLYIVIVVFLGQPFSMLHNCVGLAVYRWTFWHFIYTVHIVALNLYHSSVGFLGSEYKRLCFFFVFFFLFFCCCFFLRLKQWLVLSWWTFTSLKFHL